MSIMTALALICLTALCLIFFLQLWRRRKQNELDRYAIAADALHSLLASSQELVIYDVRQPLDLLAYPEIIPGARRIPPEEILANPLLIPKEKQAVVYCTCPSDKTSRLVLRRYLDLQFPNLKFLKGGLAAWKAQGYAVEPYRESFHLHTTGTAAGSK